MLLSEHHLHAVVKSFLYFKIIDGRLFTLVTGTKTPIWFLDRVGEWLGIPLVELILLPAAVSII